MAKEVNIDSLADKIAEKLLAAKQQAREAGEDVGEEFVKGVVDGVQKHSKEVKSEIAKMYEDFNRVTNGFKSRKSITNEDWNKVLGLSKELLKSERYANSVRDKLNGISATFKNIGKVSGLDKIIAELDRAENKLETVTWAEAGKNYKKRTTTARKPKAEKPKVQVDPKPVVKAEGKKQEAIDSTTAAITKQGEAIEKVAKQMPKIESVIKRYNKLMMDMGVEHLTIGTRFSQDTDDWGIKEMVQEAKYQLDDYYNPEHDSYIHADGLTDDVRKRLKSEVGRLKRFIATYEPYVDVVENTDSAVQSTVKATEKQTDALHEQAKAAEDAAKAQEKLVAEQHEENKTTDLPDTIKNYKELKSVLVECERLAGKMEEHKKPEIINVVESGSFKPVDTSYAADENKYVSIITEAWNEYKKLENSVGSADEALIKAEKTVTALAVSYARAHKELSAFNNEELETFTSNKYNEYDRAKQQESVEWGLHGTKTKANNKLFSEMSLIRNKLLFGDKGSKIFSDDIHGQLLDSINQIILHGGKANDVIGSMAKLMGFAADEAEHVANAESSDNVVESNQRKITSYQELLTVLQEYFSLTEKMAKRKFDDSFVDEFERVMPDYTLDDINAPEKKLSEIMTRFKNVYKMLSGMKKAQKDGIDFIDSDNMRIDNERLGEEIDYATTKLAAMARVYMDLGGNFGDFNKLQQKVVTPKLVRYDKDSAAVDAEGIEINKINAPIEAAQNEIRELLQSMLPIVGDSEKLAQMMTDKGPWGEFTNILSKLNANANVFDMIEPERAAKELSRIFGFEVPQAIEKAEAAQAEFTAETQDSVVAQDKLKESAKETSNVIYHAGDLSNIENTLKSFPLGNVPPTRSNGIGGLTGLYTTDDLEGFIGNEWQGAPISTIDPSAYKMLNARTNDIAERVGGFLNDVNATIYGYYNAIDENDWEMKHYTDVKSVDELYRAHQEIFKESSLTFEQFTKFINDSKEKIAGKSFANIELPAIDEGIAKSGISSAMQDVTAELFNSDSFQTQFLKMLGYEGVDLRGTKYNGTYSGGTVIFDVKPESVKATNEKWSDVMSRNGYEVTEDDLKHEEKRRQLAFDTAKAYSKQVDAIDSSIAIKKDENTISNDLKETFDIIQQGDSITGRFVTTAKTAHEALENMRNALPDDKKAWSSYIDGLLNSEDNYLVDSVQSVSRSMGRGSEQYKLENLGDGRVAITFSGIREEIEKTVDTATDGKKSLQDVLELINKMSGESGDSDAFNKRNKALIDKANDLTSGADYDQLYSQLIENENKYQQELEETNRINKEREGQLEAYAQSAGAFLGDSKYDSVAFDDKNKLFESFGNKIMQDGLSASDAMDQLYLSMEKLIQQSKEMPDDVIDGFGAEKEHVAETISNLQKLSSIDLTRIFGSVDLKKFLTDLNIDELNHQAFRTLFEELMQITHAMANGVDVGNAFNLKMDEITNTIMQLGGNMLDLGDDTYAEEMKQFLEHMNKIRVQFNDTIKADYTKDQWKSLHNRYKSTYLTSDVTKGIPADSLYHELNGLYPDLFPDGVLSQQDQFKLIFEKLDEARRLQANNWKTLYGFTSDDRDGIQSSVDDIYNQMSGSLFADTSAQKLNTEADAFKEVEQSATKAANAKGKFSQKNKELGDGAAESSSDLDDEAESLENVNRAAANLPDISAYDSTTVRYDANGNPYNISGTSRLDMVDGTHVRSTDNYQYNEENGNWEYLGTTQSTERTREMVQALEEYYRVLNQIQKLRLDPSNAIHTEEINKLETDDLVSAYQRVADLGIQVNDIENQINLSVSQRQALLDVERRARQDMYDVIAKMEDKQATTATKPFQKTVSDEIKKAANIDTNIRLLGDDGVSDRLQAQIADYRRLVDQLVEMRLQLARNSDLTNDINFTNRFADTAKRAQNARVEIEGVFKETQKLQKIGTLVAVGSEDVSRVDNLRAAMVEFASSALDGEVKINGFNKEGTEMYLTLSQGADAVQNITVALNKATGHLGAFTTGTSKATNEWEDFKAKAIDGAKNILGMYVGFQEGVQAIRTGAEYVKEIDLAMTELKKVTDETDASYKQFLKDAGNTSAVIGSTVRDFIEATATFARLGYSLEDASSMAETAIIYKNVADGLDTVEESSDSIISTMMAFGIEANDTMSIIDKFNAVGNNFAITSAGIGDALQRSASALFSAGNTIDESVALVTAANSVIQNPEQVGTALKTLALRLRGAKTELEEAGLETDNMAESTSTLQAKLNALTHGKVDIMLDADTFKSTTQILREMSDAWEEMTDIERAAALELMGGKRQANILSSVIQNFETVESVIETSMNSSGSAMAENAKWLDSIEGKTYQFTNALQTMWSNMLDSEMIKAFLDFGTGMIEILDTGAGKAIAFAAAIRLFSQFKGINISGVVQGLGQSIQQINNATQALNALSAADTVNGVFNPSSIAAYAAAVSQLTPKMQAQALATKGLSNEQVRHALALNGVNEANTRVAMSQIKVTQSTQQSTAVTGADAAAILASQQVKLSDAAASFLQENSTKQVTKEMLKNAVAAGTLTKAEATQISVSLGLTSTNLGLASSFKAIGASISFMFNSNPIGFILNIVTAVMSLLPVFKMLIKSTEDTGEAFNEAISTIRETQNEFRNLKKSADEIIPRFAELAKGVDKFGNNVSLTDDEYKEFISLNNEIADLFPEINAGMDANGNAMLSLSYTSDTLTQSLWSLVEAERAVANQEIADTMPDVLSGIKQTVAAYDEEKQALQYRVEAYQEAKSVMDDIYSAETKQDYKDAYGSDWEAEWKERARLASQGFISQMQEAFGAFDNPEAWNKLIERFTIDGEIDWYRVLNSAEMQNALAGLENQLDDYQTRISKAWQQLNPVVAAWANTDYTFNNLSKNMQSAAQVMIANFDFSEFGNKTEAEIQNYIKTNIINKIDELTPAVQKKLTSLLSINANDYSLADYKNKINSIVNEITASSNFTYEELMQRTGYSDVLKDYERTANNILEILDDSIPKYYESMATGTTQHFKALDRYGVEVQELKDKIYSMSPDEITKSFDIIAKYGIKTWDELAEALAKKTFDVVLNYDAEKEGREKLLAAIEESVSATGLSAESIANLKNRYQDLESYDPARLFEETANGIHLNTKALNELEREYENLNKTNLDQKLKGLTDQYDALTLQIEGCANASERALLYAQRNNVLNQINDTATLAAQYAGLTSAYNKWQEVQSGKDERNMYEGLISGKKELDEEMKRGWLDQGSIKYLELLSGKDLSTAKYDEILAVYKQLNQQIAGKYDVFDFFTADSSGNSTTAGIYNFFDTVLAKSKEIEEKIGRQVISKNADGGYVFDFGVDGDKAIADALGISEELVQIILRAAKDAGFDINLDSAYSKLADLKDEVDVINDRLKELGATDYTFNINSTDIDQVKRQIAEAEIALNNLKNEDGTLRVGVSEEDYQNTQTLLATLIYQKQTLDESIILKIDTSAINEGDVQKELQALLDYKEAYNDFEVKTAIGVDTTEAKQKLDEAQAKLGELPKEHLTTLNIDLSKTPEQINADISNITKDALLTIGVNDDAIIEYQNGEYNTEGTVVWGNNTDKVTSWMAESHVTNGEVIWDNNLNNIPTYFSRMGYITWVGRADGTANVSGNAYADGTWGAQKTETALVGELGPELIVDPRSGKWHTVGDNGAEFTQVKKGDIIFNHKQTEELLKNGHVTGRGKAYASGTAFSSGSGPGRYTVTSAHVNSSGSGSDKDDDDRDDSEQVVDFIEMKLEEIEAIIEKTSTRIANFLDDTTSIKSKDELYDELIKAEKDKSEAYLAAAQKYNVEAAAALSGVPQEYQEMARNGAIEIKDFIGEDQVEIAEAIQKYREFAAKADEAENGHLEAIAAISAHRVEQLEDIATDFENIISISKSHSDLLQAEMDFIEESGNRLSESYYEELKKHSQKQLDDMQDERVALQKILDDSVAAGDVIIGSDDWYSMLETIYEVDQEIIDCKTSLEEFQNAINELYWDNLDKLIAEIDAVDSELSNLFDLISDDDKVVDEMGNWTDEGVTALGLLAQQMEVAQQKSKEYGNAIDKLKKDYADGLYSTDEYNERLADLTDSQYDAIKSYEDAKDAIVDLNKTRAEAVKKYIQEEIDAYSELIEKKKESLNADKEARDFEKQVQESNENIRDIERQIAVLQGNTSSSAMAQRKRLEAELLKAREELNDLYYDHSIEKQQEALDKELEDYTKNKEDQMDALDEYLEKEEQVIADSFDLIAENTKNIANTLIGIAEEYGVSISDTVATPWINGANAIGTYQEQLNTSISATTANLKTLEQNLESLQAQADKTAESIVAATHSTVIGTNDGHQTSIKGYAKGSNGVEYDQWAILDELGEELQLVPNKAGRLDYIKKGTAILNNTLTERLINLAMDPTSMIENNRPVIGAPGITTTNNTFTIDASVGTLLHVEHLDGSNPADVAELIDKAWEKKMQTLNNSIKKFTR